MSDCCFPSVSFKIMKLCILMKFCICIAIYKIVVGTDDEHDFIRYQQLWPLIDVKILFSLSILRMKLCILMKFCICIDIYNILVRTDNELDFIYLQQSYGP